jgi:hypothetical protein
MWNEAEAMIRPELSIGEQLLWFGHPDTGYRFQPGGRILFGVVLALAVGVLAIYVWELETKLPQHWLFDVAIMSTLVFLLLHSRYREVKSIRRDTFYGLSDERILIVRLFRGRRVQSISLKSLSEISLQMRGESIGTLEFGPATSSTPWDGIFASPRALFSASFDAIEDARTVFDLVRKAQSAAQEFGVTR